MPSFGLTEVHLAAGARRVLSMLTSAEDELSLASLLGMGALPVPDVNAIGTEVL